MSKVKIHGTYPFDELNAWERLGKISIEEAKKLTGVTEEYEPNCLWMNKGFVVIELREQDEHEGLSSIQAAIGERTGGVLSPRIEPGMRAVYQFDGAYYLIQRILPVPHRNVG